MSGNYYDMDNRNNAKDSKNYNPAGAGNSKNYDPAGAGNSKNSKNSKNDAPAASKNKQEDVQKNGRDCGRSSSQNKYRDKSM